MRSIELYLDDMAVEQQTFIEFEEDYRSTKYDRNFRLLSNKVNNYRYVCCNTCNGCFRRTKERMDNHLGVHAKMDMNGNHLALYKFIKEKTVSNELNKRHLPLTKGAVKKFVFPDTNLDEQYQKFKESLPEQPETPVQIQKEHFDILWIEANDLTDRKLQKRGSNKSPIWHACFDGDAPVVLKEYPPNMAHEFQREFSILKEIRGSSPHLINLIGVTKIGDNICLVTEKVGAALYDRSSTDRLQLSRAEFWNIIQSIAAGLRRLHYMGYVHGDLALRNILYERKTNSVKIIDFGCSKLESSDEILPKEKRNALGDCELRLLGTTSFKSDVYDLAVCIRLLFALNFEGLKNTSSYSKKNTVEAIDLSSELPEIWHFSTAELQNLNFVLEECSHQYREQREKTSVEIRDLLKAITPKSFDSAPKAASLS
eukprot:TRINITY_DN10871_c0_g1_i1.p1 TRINITY_DN10871_c0_g1~~TRINITY_DN10871_c0_g1_i1.p1  ORF type:complete len:427 (+),score=71.73 TRINITY_DN10871_c0_g1_i1:231-1511(+)